MVNYCSKCHEHLSDPSRIKQCHCPRSTIAIILLNRFFAVFLHVLFIIVGFSAQNVVLHNCGIVLLIAMNTRASILSDTTGREGKVPEEEGTDYANLTTRSNRKASADEELDYNFDCTGMFYWQPAIDLAEVTLVAVSSIQ